MEASHATANGGTQGNLVSGLRKLDLNGKKNISFNLCRYDGDCRNIQWRIFWYWLDYTQFNLWNRLV